MADFTPPLNPDSKYSIQSFPGNGSTTSWELQLTGGYIRREHIKAFIVDSAGTQTPASITFVNDYTISRTPAVPTGSTLWVYRDTPKDLPLVDFTDGSGLDERSLDTLAKQSVFVGAELVDRFADVSTNSAEALTKASVALTTATEAQENADAALLSGSEALTVATETAGQFDDLLATVEDLSGADLSGLARWASVQTWTAPQVFTDFSINDTLGRLTVFGDGTFRRSPTMGDLGPTLRFNDWNDLSNKPLTFAPDPHSHPWGQISGKPLTYPPEAHTHSYGSLLGIPSEFPPAVHQHGWSQIADKPNVAINDQAASFLSLTVAGSRVPTITVSTSPPSGGVNGDIWIVV